MKKCLVDLTYIDKDTPTGVSVFAIRLLSGLMNFKQDVEYSFLVDSHSCAYIKELFPLNDTFDHIKSLRKWSFYNIIYQKKSKALIRDLCNKNDFDCLFIPFLTIWNSIPKEIKTISVVHDVQPIMLNSLLKNLLYRRLFLNNLTLSDSIITISKYSEAQLVHLFGSCCGKTHVIYNSIDVEDAEQIDDQLLEKPFILNVNAMAEYKNQAVIVKAFERIKDDIPHNLVFKSKRTGYWNKTVFPLIERLNLQDRVFLVENNYSSKQMNWLYSKAALFVNTSLMEGFGYTPIEAAINKTEVLTSKISALEETTLNLLNYIENPLDDIELSEKILFLLRNPSSIKSRIRLSKIFAEKYSMYKQAFFYHQQLFT